MDSPRAVRGASLERSSRVAAASRCLARHHHAVNFSRFLRARRCRFRCRSRPVPVRDPGDRHNRRRSTCACRAHHSCRYRIRNRARAGLRRRCHRVGPALVRRDHSSTRVPSFNMSKLGAPGYPPNMPWPELRSPATPSATPLIFPSGASCTVSADSPPVPPR